MKKYNEHELYYRNTYNSILNSKENSSLSEAYDIDYLQQEKLIISEKHTFYNPSTLTESYIFDSKEKNNVLTIKHNRYTPVFLHKHGFFELIYVYSGSVTQEISGEQVKLKEGDLCIIPPEVEHSIYVFDDSIAINVLIRKSTFNDTFLEVISEENILSSFFIKILYTNNYNSYIIFRNNNNPKIKEMLSNIIIEDIENKKYANKILDNLLMALFGYLLRDQEGKVELPKELQKSTQQLTSILAYIQDNFKNVSLEELSKVFHFTVPYLSKLIKLNAGHTFKEIIQTIKLNKAVELLILSSLKIYAISEAIGYENTTHFIRTFKKVYGISPNQYRKNNNQDHP